MSSQTSFIVLILSLVSLSAASSNFRSWNVTVNHETCLLLQVWLSKDFSYPSRNLLVSLALLRSSAL